MRRASPKRTRWSNCTCLNAPFDLDGIVGSIDDADELVYRLSLIIEAQLVPHSQVIIDLRIVRFLVQLQFRDTLHQLLLFPIQFFDAQGNLFFGRVLTQLAYLLGYDKQNIVKGEARRMGRELLRGALGSLVGGKRR